MYNPEHFENQNPTDLLELIDANPFATLISTVDGRPFVNHLPLIAEKKSTGPFTLLGHMARGNPQWRHFEVGPEIVVVFHGPHTYITPSWYRDPLNVPTWNYAVVHIYGVPKLVETTDGIRTILAKSVNRFENAEKKPWRFELPEEYADGLVGAIVGFEITVTRTEGKFKLSQNRAPADRQGVLDGLKTRPDEMSRKVRDLMLTSK